MPALSQLSALRLTSAVRVVQRASEHHRVGGATMDRGTAMRPISQVGMTTPNMTTSDIVRVHPNFEPYAWCCGGWGLKWGVGGGA